LRNGKDLENAKGVGSFAGHGSGNDGKKDPPNEEIAKRVAMTEKIIETEDEEREFNQVHFSNIADGEAGVDVAGEEEKVGLEVVGVVGEKIESKKDAAVVEEA